MTKTGRNQRLIMGGRSVEPGRGLFCGAVLAQFLVSLTSHALAEDCSAVWTPGFGPPGVEYRASSFAVFDDGTGHALYVGGSFTEAGGLGANYIAKWDGTQWSALGSGVTGEYPYVSALAVFDDGTGPALYVGGRFVTAGGVPANYIAKWDGTQWSALGSGMNGAVYAMTVFDDGTGLALYAGGGFTEAGGLGANCIAKWDGAQWSALGSGMNGAVYAMTVFDDGTGPALYAGGGFTTAGGVTVDRIAKWGGAQWSALGSGTNGTVYAMTVFDDSTGPALYAGGAFITAGGVTVNKVAEWDGTQWSALGSGVAGPYPNVYALAAFDDGTGPALYTGGNFTTAGGVPANYVAKWDGTQWSALGSTTNSAPSAFAVFDDGTGPALYAGGGFTYAGGGRVNGVAKWNGAQWSALGAGMENAVSAFAVFDDGTGSALYAGGYFTTAGGVRVNRTAKWDGNQWLALGSGINNPVYALTVFDDGTGPALYAGGSFGIAGGVLAQNIAKWDGTQWSALGSGTNGPVRALAVFDDGTGPALYAGGSFTTAGGVTVNRIAKWNGTQWSALGSGTSGYVHALAVFDDGAGPALYAGGEFYAAGGVTVYRVARWDGSQWSALGSGVTGSYPDVYALTVFNDGTGPALYAGGGFTTAGGVTVNSIARWDGTQWSALGSGMDGSPGRVYALTVFDDGIGPALYAGGEFTAAGGVTVNSIAKWDGTQWFALGSGTDRDVYALTAFDDGTRAALYAGGGFWYMGGVPSLFIARWKPAPLPEALIPDPPTLADVTAATFIIADLGDANTADFDHAVQETLSGQFIGPAGRLQDEPFWQPLSQWTGWQVRALSAETAYYFRSKARDECAETDYGVEKELFTSRAGDVDGDAAVNDADIAIVQAALGTEYGQPGFDARCDLNGDDRVTYRDLLIVRQNLDPPGPIQEFSDGPATDQKQLPGGNASRMRASARSFSRDPKGSGDYCGLWLRPTAALGRGKT